MRNLFDELERPLPETLFGDLEELFTWDNNCYLTWVNTDGGNGDVPNRWFTVRLTAAVSGYALSFDFWIPDWMPERGVAAMLPASLAVTAFKQGESAQTELPPRSAAELQATLPRVARTCSRLINELWGPTDSSGLMLMEMGYQDRMEKSAFPHARSGQ